MSAADNVSSAQKLEDSKRLKRFKILSPLNGFLSSSYVNLEGYYITFFLTNIYMLSVTYTAALSVIASALSWVFSPFFAAFIDRFQFKKSKYWPWLVIGSTGVQVGLFLIMALPAFGLNLAALGPAVFALQIIVKVAGQVQSVPSSGTYVKMSKTPADRQYFAVASKVSREAGKTVFGYVIPWLLALLTAASGSELKGYMLIALLCYGFTLIVAYIYAVYGFKGSYVEREGLEETQKAKAEKIPMSAVLKALITNRPVLGMFLFFTLHKTAYFIYVAYGTYVFTYVFEDTGALLGLFFSIFSLSAVIGALAGRIWTKIFKDSKRSCVMAMGTHTALTLVIAVFFRTMPAGLFLGIFAVSSFFMGMLENWVMPLFAACSEYGAWKTGTRSDSLVMSVFGLTVNVSWALTPMIAAAVLNAVKYTEFVAGGGAVTETILSGLSFLFAWLPLILAALSLASLVFIYNLNDAKMKQIQQDLEEGRTEASSAYKI